MSNIVPTPHCHLICLKMHHLTRCCAAVGGGKRERQEKSGWIGNEMKTVKSKLSIPKMRLREHITSGLLLS